MAISNLRLNVTANTARALADFNKFSRSLDNKFLISGLKLDVVRNALGQINRDFQRAIGEQGLASASSLRAAQNQAALLTQTFKGFASESALSITQNIGTALNNVAVRAGGTMKDVQKTLAATPFIDINLSEDLRNKLAKGILSFQRDMRRAGLGENFGGLAQQFLMGQATGMQMLNSGDAMQSFLGSQIIKRVGGEGMLYSPEERTRVLSDILNDPEIQKQLSEMAKRAAGFRIILEDLNTKLFNTESGVFGSLRKVIDRTGKSTTMFDEVYKLVDQVFGPNGMFRAIFSSIQEIFGIGDPMRPFIDAIQFVTRIFNDLTAYFESSGFKDILVMVRETFGRVGELFKGVYDQIRGGTFDSEDITQVIIEIGTNMRQYIKNIGEGIRNLDDDEAIGFVSDIAGTLFEEVGKTAIVLIRELFTTLVDKAPEIASSVLPALNKGINNLLDETFGGFSKVIKPLLATLPGPLGMIARASMITDVTGGQGGLGLLGAVAPFLLAGGGGLAGAAGRIATGTGRGATAFRTMGLGLAGFDPTLSLLGGFAPQLLSGVPGALKTANSARVGFLNSGLAARISGTLGAVGPTSQAAGRFLSNQLGRGAATASGYLGAVGPLAQRTGSFAVNQLARIENLYNTAYVGARGVGRQFLSGLRPGAFPTFRSTPTAPYQVGQFIRNVPGNIASSLDPVVNAVSSLGPKLSNAANVASRTVSGFSSKLATVAVNAGSSIVSLGSTIYRSSVSLAGNMATSARLFAAGSMLPGGYRLPGGVPMATRAGQAFGRFAPGALAGGALVLGSQMLGRSIGGDAGQQVSAVGSVLGGGLGGASTGAMIGSMIAPGVGTAAGAVIGGIIGGVAPLLDKGVRDGIGKFVSGIGTTMSEFGSGIVRGLNEIANNTLQAIGSLPSLMGNIVKSVYNSLPAPVKSTMGFFNSVWSGVTGFVSRINLPNMFNEGKDYIGGTMALEARLSGNRPMVVNDGEFVIPRDGFPILAGLVGENLRTTGVINNGANQPIQVNVSLSVTANSVVADANELATVLREPVYKIVGDAWDEAVNATRVHRARVN
jgi:phage-related protein